MAPALPPETIACSSFRYYGTAFCKAARPVRERTCGSTQAAHSSVLQLQEAFSAAVFEALKIYISCGKGDPQILEDKPGGTFESIVAPVWAKEKPLYWHLFEQAPW